MYFVLLVMLWFIIVDLLCIINFIYIGLCVHAAELTRAKLDRKCAACLYGFC